MNYTTVRNIVPKLWNLGRDRDGDGDGAAEPDQPPLPPPSQIDVAIHIGMAGPRLFYSIERRGHRSGYVMPDVDGEVPRGGVADGDEGEEKGPEELESAFDVEDVLRRWRWHSPVRFLFLFLVISSFEVGFWGSGFWVVDVAADL